MCTYNIIGDDMSDKYKQNMEDLECAVEIEEAIDFEFYKVLFEPIRSEIIKYLAVNGQRNIKEIAKNFTQDRSVISRHLELMKRHGIVNKMKQSRNVLYKLNDEYVIKKFEKTTESLKNLVNNR